MAINSGMFTSETEEWNTPRDLFEKIQRRYRIVFDLDPCATDENHTAPRWLTKTENGLICAWSGDVFVNPPYGRGIGAWVKKCHDVGMVYPNRVVALLPARTDTKWFHDYILGCADIAFIRGRVHFNDSKNAAPFPSMIVIWNGNTGIPHDVGGFE